MNDLPLLRHQVLILAFINKLPAQEISERLSCSVSYVYKQKCLALQKLKETRGSDDRGQ
jgi:DNA-directed RNA polymerase specialized sigma24 family protein